MESYKAADLRRRNHTPILQFYIYNYIPFLYVILAQA
jgi:hypothetical protein